MTIADAEGNRRRLVRVSLLPGAPWEQQLATFRAELGRSLTEEDRIR